MGVKGAQGADGQRAQSPLHGLVGKKISPAPCALSPTVEICESKHRLRESECVVGAGIARIQ